MRILGIDPGSRLAGYGCVEILGNQLRHITHGTLKLISISGKSEISFEDRLLALYQGISSLIVEFKPSVMSVEKVFFAKNVSSALKLGQARGAIILTGKIHAMTIVEYSATEVKKTVAGYGQASKEQVAKMVGILTGQKNFQTHDASDGLALALCHAYVCRSGGYGVSQLSLHSQELRGRKKKLSLAESVSASLKIPETSKK